MQNRMLISITIPKVTKRSGIDIANCSGVGEFLCITT